VSLLSRHSLQSVARFLAFDLGAQSGRALLGTLDQGVLLTEEMARFPNRTVSVHGHQYWDIWHLYDQMKRALATCAEQESGRILSLGVDTWGVDFGLIARDGSVLGLPCTYRDPRTKGVMSKFLKRVRRERIYELTGIQFLPINTLYQLYAMKLEKSPVLEAADSLLFMPDLFNYLLTGAKVTEYTVATTSQLYDSLKREWCGELFEALGVPASLMRDVAGPGSEVGRLDRKVCEETGFPNCRVMAPASHDTAAAVAAVPARGDDWMFISSGTWSLVGIEVPKPNRSEAARRLNFTNEGGVGGTYRLLKNITGLWLLQQLARSWGETAAYGALVKEAAEAAPLRAILDPDASSFRCPDDMGKAIAEYCRRTRQPVPRSRAEHVRSVLESLALKYRTVRDELEKVTGKKLERVHIVGGGACNGLLCQMTADALGLPVYAGPAEATAIGNIMVQAMAAGLVSSLEEIRTIVRESFEVRQYKPRPAKEWDASYERFCGLAGEKQ
jgi:rhamnulokinase